MAGNRLERSSDCGAIATHKQRLVLGGRDGVIRLYDAESGTWQKDLSGHSAQILALAFSPDGQRLASVADNQSLRIWDIATGTETASLKCPGDAPSWLAFDSTGKRLVSGSRSRGPTSIWNLEKLRVETSFKDHSHTVGCFLAGTSDLILGQGVGAISICSRPELERLRLQVEHTRTGPDQG